MMSKCFGIFWLSEAQYNSRYFCQDCECDKLNLTVRRFAHLILSKCYSPDLPL